MNRHLKFYRCLQLVTLAILSLSLVSLNTADGEVILKSWRTPLVLKLRESVRPELADTHQPVHLVLTEDYTYQQTVLPQGTEFTAIVNRSEPSQRFLRPGFVRLQIQALQMPTGETVTFPELMTRNIVYEDAVTVKRFAGSAIPFTLVSAADSIPLSVAANWSTWETLPISFGSRILLGMALEHTSKEKKRHDKTRAGWGKRYAHGAYRGTGIPGVLSIFRKYPEPDLSQDAPIPVRFSKQAFERLFNAVPITESRPLQNP